MRQVILFFYLLILVLSSCETSAPSMESTLFWQLGENQESYEDVISELVGNEVQLRILEGSLCPNTGIEIIILENGEELYNERFDELPINETVVFEDVKSLSISSKIYEKQESNVNCKRLGIADCILEFMQ